MKTKRITWAATAAIILLAGAGLAELLAPMGRQFGSGATVAAQTRRDSLIGVSCVLNAETAVDARMTGTTTLFTATTDILPQAVIFRANLATSVSAAPVIGIGVASGEDDVMFPTPITLTATGDSWVVADLSESGVILKNEAVKVGVDTGATATFLTLDVIVVGIPLGN